MAGYDLKEGSYDDKHITDEEIWTVFNSVFSTKSRNASSYKFGFLKAILDNLYNVDDDKALSFDQVFGKFSEIYWNLILKYGIRQNADNNRHRITSLEKILFDAKEEFAIAEGIQYERIPDSVRKAIEHRIKQQCKRYVIGALFSDTQGLLYSFSKKEEWIKFNPYMYDFLCRHKLAIEKLNYYEWAKYLERINDFDVVSKLLNKIETSSKRTNLSVFRDVLYVEFECSTCFYCGRKLRPGHIEVDHFIPWSFVKDDQLWNLVLSCDKCNRSKSDSLPDEKYLDYLIDRNDLFLSETQTREMAGSHEKRLKQIYKWAECNGYDKKWQPKKAK